MLFAFALLPLISLLSLGYAYQALEDETLKHLPGPGDDFDIKKGSILAPILIPRVSGTDGNALVRQHFLNFFKSQLPEWRIEMHNSTSTTPVSKGKEVPFVNVIATRDPPGSLRGMFRAWPWSRTMTASIHRKASLEPSIARPHAP
jgi:hypothetical protein